MPKTPSNENIHMQNARKPNKEIMVRAIVAAAVYNGNSPSMSRLRFGSSTKSLLFSMYFLNARVYTTIWILTNNTAKWF